MNNECHSALLHDLDAASEMTFNLDLKVGLGEMKP